MTPRRSEGPGSVLQAQALEAWLHAALAARFDATLAEAVPAELLALLATPH